MSVSTAALVSELHTLLRLTNTEAQIAQTRRSQATTKEYERELDQNAKKCDERARLLAQAIRDLGGLPDVVGAALGRVGALAKTQFEQTQSFPSALLGDLALEHQLRDRARFAKVLAESLNERKIVTLMERLEVAHSATIEWIENRLAEIAVGGPAALRPTPMQTAVGFAQRAAWLPVKSANVVLNRSVATVDKMRNRTEARVGSTVERTRVLAGAAGSVLSAGRDAALKRTEQVAHEQGEGQVADNVHRTRQNLGVVDAAELPIRNYDGIAATTVIGRLEKLEDPQDVRAVLAYEQVHANRKGVVNAAQKRIEELARERASA